MLLTTVPFAVVLILVTVNSACGVSISVSFESKSILSELPSSNTAVSSVPIGAILTELVIEIVTVAGTESTAPSLMVAAERNFVFD